MAPEKVSVIVPTLNAGAPLERCIRSVLDQTYPRKELIVIDGGSRDGTLDVIRRHQDSIAHWTTAPDGGVYPAMMRGAAAATGDWLYFLGADDALYDARVLEKVFGAGTADCDVIYGDVWWRDGRLGGRTDAYTITRRNVCHQGIFLRRSVFDRLGGFNPDYPLLADYAMNLSLFGDPRVRKRRVDFVIAHFASGGRSERGDERFARDRQRLVREHIRVSKLTFFLLMLRYRLFKKRTSF